ncbi:LytR/AlgR family response regulator transcription factor [Parapedobacter sp. 2B3]|uniref:LytR/AlgR family response regulator transcription factor n=1 Tax=Parapedobacter sp. 2B3 TaxID=3342381 RepID=UPI0035B5E3FD
METTFSAIVIDDNRRVHTDILAMVREHARLRDLAIVRCFTTCSAALRFLERHGPVDVVLCDIELRDENGLHEAHRFFRHTAFFLLITVYPDYKAAAMDKGVHGYIVKPVDPLQVRSKLDELDRIRRSGRIMGDADQTLFIKDVDDPVPVKVLLRDVRAITVDPRRPNILRVDTVGRVISHRNSLSKYKKRFLEWGLFVQLDQSVLVAQRYVDRLENGMVWLDSGYAYPVSRRYARALTILRDYLSRRDESPPMDDEQMEA